jgi:hypothetical protein
MSDYDYEQGYAPDPADLEALVAQSADQAAQTVHEAYAPYLQQQQEQINMLSQHAAAQAAQAYREDTDRDQQAAAEAKALAEAQLPAGWLKEHGPELAEQMKRQPGWLPDAVLDNPRDTADAVVTAAHRLMREQQRTAAVQEQQRLDRELGEMKRGLGGGLGPSWREIRESGKSVQDILNGR